MVIIKMLVKQGGPWIFVFENTSSLQDIEKSNVTQFVSDHELKIVNVYIKIAIYYTIEIIKCNNIKMGIQV